MSWFQWFWCWPTLGFTSHHNARRERFGVFPNWKSIPTNVWWRKFPGKPIIQTFVYLLLPDVWTGPYLRFQNCGCRFSQTIQKTVNKGTFVWKLRVENHSSKKSMGAKSVFLKIYGYNCTHCTHTNQVSDVPYRNGKKCSLSVNILLFAIYILFCFQQIDSSSFR